MVILKGMHWSKILTKYFTKTTKLNNGTRVYACIGTITTSTEIKTPTNVGIKQLPYSDVAK